MNEIDYRRKKLVIGLVSRGEIDILLDMEWQLRIIGELQWDDGFIVSKYCWKMKNCILHLSNNTSLV